MNNLINLDDHMKLNDIGVIVKIEGEKAYVMTDEGEFKIIKRKSGMFPGKKTLITNDDLIKNNNHMLNPKFIGIAGTAVACCLFIIASFLFLYRENPTFAYFSVDINPSFEFSIDEDKTIKNVRYINDDADSLLKGLKLKGLNINTALIEVIRKSEECGYFKNKKERNCVLVTGSLVKSTDKEFDDLINKLKNNLQKIYSNEIDIKFVKVSNEYRKMSMNNNISMGRYLIYSKASKTNKAISIEEARQQDLFRLFSLLNIKEYNKTEFNTAPKTTNEEKKSSPTPNKSGNKNTATNRSKIHKQSTPSMNTSNNNKNTSTPSKVVVNNQRTNNTVSTPLPTPDIKAPAIQKSEDALCMGLLVEYYNDSDFNGLVLKQIDSKIDFRWGEGTPNSAIDCDTFSIRWSGLIEPKFSENYKFSTYADDGVRLWVNNILIIDNWKSQSPVETTGSLELVSGKKYNIKLEYFENIKSGQVKLYWESSSQKKEIIPPYNLYHLSSVYQAENANYSKGIIETINKGFTGEGYINYKNELEGFIEWTVRVEKSGLYTLNFGYANGTKTKRPMEIKVNNSIIKSLDFKSTSSWTKWESTFCTIQLEEGINIIRATAKAEEGGPNIDYLEILKSYF